MFLGYCECGNSAVAKRDGADKTNSPKPGNALVDFAKTYLLFLGTFQSAYDATAGKSLRTAALRFGDELSGVYHEVHESLRFMCVDGKAFEAYNKEFLKKKDEVDEEKLKKLEKEAVALIKKQNLAGKLGKLFEVLKGWPRVPRKNHTAAKQALFKKMKEVRDARREVAVKFAVDDEEMVEYSKAQLGAGADASAAGAGGRGFSTPEKSNSASSASRPSTAEGGARPSAPTRDEMSARARAFLFVCDRVDNTVKNVVKNTVSDEALEALGLNVDGLDDFLDDFSKITGQTDELASALMACGRGEVVPAVRGDKKGEDEEEGDDDEDDEEDEFSDDDEDYDDLMDDLDAFIGGDAAAAGGDDEDDGDEAPDLVVRKRGDADAPVVGSGGVLRSLGEVNMAADTLERLVLAEGEKGQGGEVNKFRAFAQTLLGASEEVVRDFDAVRHALVQVREG